ncbi:MAG: GYD domain-containing protein [Polyangiaceae bacterium]|jgi:uncharacterized protein with GYD domain
MIKYLMQGDYTAEGVKGLLKDGGSAREQAVKKLLASLGGTLDSMYFSPPTYFIVANLPDPVTAAALAATVFATGAVSPGKSSEILTPTEMDEAAKKHPTYRAPGI